jgi:hypothetical protein
MTGTAAPQPFRCADAARDRGDDLTASAPPATRLLLVEVPGPWGRTALTESRLDHYVAGRLAEQAAHAGVRVLLVRRPDGRAVSERAWALADVRPGYEAMTWGRWHDPRALLEVDLDRSVRSHGPQRVALVCAHSRHDVCCALRGRPVAKALQATVWDVWECSHLGGDRFAPNVLLLPGGDLLGGLDPDTALAALGAYGDGRLDLSHWRGRYGTSPVHQAALQRAAVALGDDRRDALAVVGVEELPGERWAVEVAHVDRAGFEQRWLVHLSSRVGRPQVLTCNALGVARARTFELDGLEPLQR